MKRLIWRHWHRTWVSDEIRGRSQSKRRGGGKGLAIIRSQLQHRIRLGFVDERSRNDCYEFPWISFWIILRNKRRFRYHYAIANLFVGNLKTESIVHRRIRATIHFCRTLTYQNSKPIFIAHFRLNVKQTRRIASRATNVTVSVSINMY